MNILDLRLCHTLSQNFYFFIYTWGSFGQRCGAQLDTTNIYAVSLQQFFFTFKMVRKYIKKTNRADILEESIVLALNDYGNGNYRSSREAAEAHGLKKSTLHFRHKKIRRKVRTDEPNNEGRADELNNEDGVDEHVLNENEIEDEP